MTKSVVVDLAKAKRELREWKTVTDVLKTLIDRIENGELDAESVVVVMRERVSEEEGGTLTGVYTTPVPLYQILGTLRFAEHMLLHDT